MDLGGSITPVVTREFLAVIFSGFGNELLPLTSNRGDEVVPKGLLPVANKPLLHYTLSWLEHSGIGHVLLICPLAHRAAISHYIHSNSSFPSLRIDIQPYDQSPALSVGTCHLLRHFSRNIQEDFVLLPVDFIPPPSLPLLKLLDKFRNDTTSDGAVATTCWFEPHRPDKNAVVEEWGPVARTVPIAWEEKTMTLLYIDPPSDIYSQEEDLNLRMGLLMEHPQIKLSASLQDSHVYVCKRSVLDVLNEKTQLDSIREDFFPWLCKLHYQRSKRAKYGHVLSPVAKPSSLSLALRHTTSHVPRSNSSRSTTTSLNDGDESEGVTPSLRVGLVIHRAKEGFAGRVNNLRLYLEANRQGLLQTTFAVPSDSATRALIDQKAHISPDSIIGASTRIGEKTIVKISVIGMHCVIGKLVKIVGCVLLDHCVIADGAKLEGCVLGKNTKVGAKAELVNCVSEANFEIDGAKTYKNEKLEVSTWTGGSDDTTDDSAE